MIDIIENEITFDTVHRIYRFKTICLFLTGGAVLAFGAVAGFATGWG